MLTYKCEKCNIQSKTSNCPVCGERTKVTSVIYWCDDCNMPIYNEECPICGKIGRYLATDLRPVFPEERLLIEITLGKPFLFIDKSVWNGTGNTYYVDGKRIKFSIKNLANLDTEIIREQYNHLKNKNSYGKFESTIDKFISANKGRNNEVVSEAITYIKSHTMNYDTNDMFVSFSGGKDSTVTSDLVLKAMGTPKILHIFGDTTLEFPETMEYVKRFKFEHKMTPVLSSRNKEKDFKELCKVVGPPSRIMRWCCTIFKTGAITRKISSLFGDKSNILTFYGIRRSESNSRSKYERETSSPKIAKQTVISPIIDWTDFDVWLYLLTTKIDFNDAYRLGYARVGCWCCPNNSGWAEFLSKIHMHEQYYEFRDLLIDFAKQIGKPDPEEYTDSGNWKARQGGNGLELANKSIISFSPCATDENAFNYELQRSITSQLFELFKPFGYLNFDLGNKRLGEVYIQSKTGILNLKIQGRINSNNLKVTILNKHIAGSKSLIGAEGKIKCQLTKYQMCMGCMACVSVCKHDAITIKQSESGDIDYRIDDSKCVRCAECVGHFNAGCYMRKVLTIKR